MVKSINIQTQPAQEIRINAVGEDKMINHDQPAARLRRIRSILRAILSALIGCLITTGWSVTMSDD